jgi:hypothetical protein
MASRGWHVQLSSFGSGFTWSRVLTHTNSDHHRPINNFGYRDVLRSVFEKSLAFAMFDASVNWKTPSLVYFSTTVMLSVAIRSVSSARCASVKVLTFGLIPRIAIATTTTFVDAFHRRVIDDGLAVACNLVTEPSRPIET